MGESELDTSAANQRPEGLLQHVYLGSVDRLGSLGEHRYYQLSLSSISLIIIFEQILR